MLDIRVVIELSFSQGAWRSPTILAVKTATSRFWWKPPCRSWQVGEGASLPRNAVLMWDWEVVIAGYGSPEEVKCTDRAFHKITSGVRKAI
jgi:hypothetical protein